MPKTGKKRHNPPTVATTRTSRARARAPTMSAGPPASLRPAPSLCPAAHLSTRGSSSTRWDSGCAWRCRRSQQTSHRPRVPPTLTTLLAPNWLQVLATSLPVGTANWPQVPLTATGFALSPASEPFPQKLVERIRSGQYVDMWDLLTDNISQLQQLEAFGG